MAWQTPKTDWSAEDGVRDDDLNRIEGNILELRNTSNNTSDKVLYVNASTGSDSNSGAASAPFRTIGKALSVLSRNVGNYDVRISVAAGTYNESVTIKGFDAPITITGTNGASVTLTGLRIEGCHVTISNIAITLNSALWVVHGANLVCDSAIVSNGYGITVSYCSKMFINSLVCNNVSGYAVTVDRYSSFYVTYLDGDANANGITCKAGSLAAYGAINMEISGVELMTQDGGRIYSGAQTSISKY